MLTFEAGAAAIEAGYITAQHHLSELRALTEPLPAPWLQQLAHLQRRVKLAWHVLRGPTYPRYRERQSSREELKAFPQALSPSATGNNRGHPNTRWPLLHP